MSFGLKFRTAFFLFLLCSLAAYSHNLKGVIKAVDGTPIPYATVFVKEASLGVTTNDEGKFQLDLRAGTYTINFRSMGYIPKVQTVVVTQKSFDLNIVLEEQLIQINTIDINSNSEDAAYGIMRKVIALSYVHLNQVSSFAADVYLRGTVKFEKIPALIRNQLHRNKIDIKSGDVFINETVSAINFSAPDKYEQKIVSVNSTFPKVVDFSVDGYLGTSLYQDNINVMFSPLGRNAFTYYNYRYEGYSQEGKYTVNKIKVIPKRKSKQLFDGTIYIIEDLWCLSKADLSFETPLGTVKFRLVFDEVNNGVWLPVGHDYTFNGGMMGVKGDARFIASIKYAKLKVNDQVLSMLNIKPNATSAPSISKSTAFSSNGLNTTSAKKKHKIGQLLEKDKLTNRDMSKLSQLMAKEDYAVKPDSLKSLEIKDKVKVTIDKQANNREVSYWTAMRPIPLSLDEIKSLSQRDSLDIISKKMGQDTSSVVSHKRNYGLLNPLFFGIRRPIGQSNWAIKYDGLISTKRISFNAVDGWNLAQSLLITKEFKPGNALALTPTVAYAFGRSAALGSGVVKYTYSPLRRGSFELSFGKSTLDYNGASQAVHPFINSISSLFYKENFGRYYQSEYISATNSIDLTNGLVLSSSFKMNTNYQLENSTNFSFLKKEEIYTPNLPSNRALNNGSISDQSGAILDLKIEYTPHYFYRINRGVKVMSHANYPTFFFEYKKGIKDIRGSVSDFDYLSTGFQYNKEWSSTSSIAFDVHGGWFPNHNQVHFSDFAHAQTQTSPILLSEYRHAFFLPGYYSLSTADNYMEGHLSIRAPYIALKYLPGLSNTLWREMVWCSYYTSPTTRNYVEVGYTLLEVLLSANIGTHVGFNDGKFSNIGVNLAFRISY
ncbi:MAG: DUF5686 and carboxypeptidase regulatory-like domain-containing protein [Bacteroidia bacterium]|nr:DUF5686 and carboxypeptidase regulatory-like domain-containing protein [Bacteroidia bacterium]